MPDPAEGGRVAVSELVTTFIFPLRPRRPLRLCVEVLL